MAQSMLVTGKSFCSLCNGYYENDIYNYHLNTKYHKYATSEEDSQYSDDSKLIPILGTKVYCKNCCICFDVMERHECISEELNESNPEDMENLFHKCSVDDKPVCRSFKYYGTTYVVCLLCSTVEIGVMKHHLNSEIHEASLVDNHRQVRLDQFYLFFIDSDVEEVEKFIPYSLDRVQCLKCMQTVNYKNVMLHKNCSNNSFQLTDSISKLPNIRVYHWNNKLDYDERILNMYYPKSLMKIVFKFDKTPIYVAQKTGGSVKCLFCCVEGIIGIDQVVEHFTSFGHLMNSNNSVFNQALSTYHQSFALSDVGDQMRHHLFEPCSSNRITCLLCQSSIVLSEIKSHNCSQQTSSDSTTIVEQQSEKVTEQSNMNYIMVYSQNQKVCLCCESIMLSEKNVIEHTNSKKHKKSLICKKDIVQVYLDFWGSEERKEQKYFLPHSQSAFKCMECRQLIALAKIFDHAVECFPALYVKKEPTMYKESVKKLLYPTYTTFNECVIQKRNSQLFCLYCLVSLKGSREDHCKDFIHLKHLRNLKKMEMVEAYHNYWKYMNEEMQIRQICFRPSNRKTAECNWCQCFFPYNQVKAHNCMNLMTKDIQLLVGQFAYCEGVMKEVYPDGNFELQICKKKITCLLCNVDATSSKSKHIDGKPHKNKVNNKERVQAVVLYHRFWLSRDAELQMDQLKYRPFDASSMQCLNCMLVHSCDVLMKHKCNLPLQEVRMRYDVDIMKTVYRHMKMSDPISSFIVQRIGDNLHNCLFCRMTFSVNLNEHCRSLRHKAKANLSLWVDALNAYHQYWLSSNSPMDQIYYTSHSHVNARCVRCDTIVFFHDIATHKCPPKKGQKPPSNVYCYEVLFSIYSHLETDSMEDLFIQKLNEKTYRCLHCCIEITDNWDKHAKKHIFVNGQTMSPNAEFISKSVMRYHKFWMSRSSADIQMKQINYFPYDMENAMCVWCDSILKYNKALVNHKCEESSDSGEDDCTDDECTSVMLQSGDECVKGIILSYKGPSKLHDLIRTVLYPQYLNTMVANSHLKLHFPIFQNRSTRMRCLLCSKVLDNTGEEAIIHLKTDHGNWNRRLSSQALHVVNYHKHFEKQPIDEHYLQSYFLPGGTRSVNCIRSHKVDFSKLKDHYLKCSKRCDRKLEVSIKNFSNPNFVKQAMRGAGNVYHEMVVVPKGQFPVRLQYQAEFFRMEEAPSEKVHCRYCELDLENFSDTLLHLIDQTHLVLLRKTKHKYLYLCDICCYKTNKEIDWQKHFASSGHQNMYKNIGEIRQTTLFEFECKVCAYVLYGDNLSVFEHKEGLAGLKPNKNIRNRGQNDKKLRKIFGKEELTEMFLEELCAECELVDCPAVELCLNEIKEQLQQKYPECKLYPFGSRAIEIGNSSSDLDLFADLRNYYYGGAASYQQTIIREVTRLLKMRSDLFQAVFSIPTARTPIIRFVHANTEINCDLSFMNGLSVENTKFVKFCSELQPAWRDAILLLRKFSNIECLYGEYKICSYAFSLMLVFYMQTNGWLLSVARLRSLTNTNVKDIEGWPIIDYNKSVEMLKHNVKEYTGGVYFLVKGFFEFYNEFNFEEDVVCPFIGDILKRKQFKDDGASLPPEMSIYKKNMREPFRVDDCNMCVQDPFDLSHNLTKAVSNDAVASFKFKCRNVLQMFRQ